MIKWISFLRYGMPFSHTEYTQHNRWNFLFSSASQDNSQYWYYNEHHLNPQRNLHSIFLLGTIIQFDECNQLRQQSAAGGSSLFQTIQIPATGLKHCSSCSHLALSGDYFPQKGDDHEEGSDTGLLEQSGRLHRPEWPLRPPCGSFPRCSLWELLCRHNFTPLWPNMWSRSDHKDSQNNNDKSHFGCSSQTI